MKEIAKSLVKAQKAFGPALKSATNPHFRSKYADLSACVEAVIDALNGAGIALVQHSHECEDGVIVETVFVHESGETYSAGKLHVPASKKDPQGYGSALTYARRYSLMAACGIAPEDDDGNAASKPKSIPDAIIKADVKPLNSVGTLKPDREEAIRRVYSGIVDCFEAQMPEKALEAYMAVTDADEKVFLQSIMEKDVKRSIVAAKKEFDKQELATQA